MKRDASNKNFDLIYTASAQIHGVHDDMMRCLHRGEVPDIVRERMCQSLRNAADDLEKLTPPNN
mgnify:CR=1 FL=1